MAVNIISGNLNSYGNAGRFETDRSTWGFSDAAGERTIVRSSTQKFEGNYSALVTHYAATAGDSILTGVKCNVPGAPGLTAGKKYLFKARVYVPSPEGIHDQIAPDEALIYFSFGGLFNTPIAELTVSTTVASAKNNWVEITAGIELTSSQTLTGFSKDIVVSDDDAAPIGEANPVYNANGRMYIDAVEIFEIEIVDDPPPTCTLAIEDEGLTVVTDESAPGANDGSIIVMVSGATTPEFSLNGVDWQSSTLFAGLSAGTYTVYARESSNHDCMDSRVFSLNNTAIDFDFTVVVTHETISGANDGTAVLTPSGTGSPFTYSKNGGTSFQAGNSFSGLPPGVYAFVVKDASGNTLVKYATINAGEVEIEKVWHSRNPIYLQKQASIGWESITNYRLYNDVRVEDSPGVFTSKLKLDIHPASNGTVLFSIAEAFRDVFSFDTPAVGDSTITRLTDRIKRFKSFTGELQLQEYVPESLTESLPNLVLWGGLNKQKFPGFDYFSSYLPSLKKFLTWAPAEKYVDRTQEDYLNFFVYGLFTSLKLQIKAYFDDGTDETATVKTTSAHRYHLYRIPAGPLNSGATTINPSKNLIRYELSLLNQSDTVVSEVRTYHVIKYKHPLTRHFMFLNSLGSDEVIRFTGQSVEETSFTREMLQRFLPHDYDPKDGEFLANEVLSQKTNSYSSGFLTGKLSSNWLSYMEDFMLSPRIFMVTNGQRLPVVITGGEISREDQNYERYFRFTAKTAFDNVLFTPADV